MIPAGFLAYRGELTFGTPVMDIIVVFLCGLAGSMLGALINYYIAFFHTPFIISKIDNPTTVHFFFTPWRDAIFNQTRGTLETKIKFFKFFLSLSEVLNE